MPQKFPLEQSILLLSIFSYFESNSMPLPSFPRQSRIHLFDRRWLVCLLKIFFCGCRNKWKQKKMVNASPTNIWVICCWALPGSCGKRLFQCLDVSKLDSLSSTPGSDHITLKEKESVRATLRA